MNLEFINLEIVYKLENYILNSIGWNLLIDTPYSLVIEILNFIYSINECCVDPRINENQFTMENNIFKENSLVFDFNNCSFCDSDNKIELEKSSIFSDFTNIFKLLHYEYNLYRKFNTFIWTISCLKIVLTKHGQTKKQLIILNDIINKYHQQSAELIIQYQQAFEELNVLIENDMIIEEDLVLPDEESKNESNYFHNYEKLNINNSALIDFSNIPIKIDNSQIISTDDITSKIQDIKLSKSRNSKFQFRKLTGDSIEGNIEEANPFSLIINPLTNKKDTDYYTNINQSTKTNTDKLSNFNGMSKKPINSSNHMDIVYSPNIKNIVFDEINSNYPNETIVQNNNIFDITSKTENTNKIETNQNQFPKLNTMNKLNPKYQLKRQRDIKVSEFTLEDKGTNYDSKSIDDTPKNQTNIKTLNINSYYFLRNKLHKKNNFSSKTYNKTIFSYETEQKYKTRRSLTRKKYKISSKNLISDSKIKNEK